MTAHDRDKLLTELLAGEEIAGFRQNSLSCALNSLRRRKARKRILACCVVTCFFALLMFWAVPWKSVNKPIASTSSRATAPVAQAVASAPKIEIINDEQLLALFPNRSVALIGKPGNQQFYFLDGGDAASGLSRATPSRTVQ